jgi:hypothetical protein
MAWVHFVPNVEFAPPSPTVWIPNMVYQLQPASIVSAPIMAQLMRESLVEPKISVSLILVLGKN